MSDKQEKKLYAVLGYPIKHSLSPKIHSYWIKQHQLHANYIALPVQQADLAEILPTLPKMGFHGVNLTVPLKETAMNLCDNLSAAAENIGSVNTVIFKYGKIYGDNTDADGFIAGLHENAQNIRLKKALIIGAGGSARAVLYGLLQENFSDILIYNRTVERAEKLAEFFQSRYPKTNIEIIKTLQLYENIDLIVNCTSCGMNDINPLQVDFSACTQKIIAYDLVYAPRVTQFLADADSASHIAINGLPMLFHQAAHAFEKWFGIMPIIDDALKDDVLK